MTDQAFPYPTSLTNWVEEDNKDFERDELPGNSGVREEERAARLTFGL